MAVALAIIGPSLAHLIKGGPGALEPDEPQGQIQFGEGTSRWRGVRELNASLVQAQCEVLHLVAHLFGPG